MTALRHFPPSLMRETEAQWEPSGKVISGGRTLSGLQPLTRMDGGGLWTATMANISLRTADHVRAWRALAAICDGGAQPIIVPMCDKRFFPAPLVAGTRLASVANVPHSDGATFSDGTQYVSDVVSVTLAAAAALRATTLTVNLLVGEGLRGGEHFSIDHEILRWRLYRIRTAIDNGDGSYDITIRPPLRAAVDADKPLQFDRPKCVMQLATPDAMDLAIENRKRGRPSVSFVEAFPPYPE